MRVFKYPLNKSIQTIEIHVGARPLTVQVQHGKICLWALCDEDMPLGEMEIAVVGTGHPAPEDAKYIGTAQLNEGTLVFHVFARL